jgi:DNA-binding transcriptional LysR family regulator
MRVMTPELRLLRSFVVIAEENSLTRAAARLHIAQQSLSQQVRTLEAQLGATLLERSSRGVRLTPVGIVLVREARTLIAHADRATAAVRRAAAGEEGELRVGFLSSVANYVMPPVVRTFRARHPDVTLETHELPIAKLVRRRRPRSPSRASGRPSPSGGCGEPRIAPPEVVLVHGHIPSLCSVIAVTNEIRSM